MASQNLVKNQPFKFWGKLDCLESTKNGFAAKSWALFQALIRSGITIASLVLMIVKNDFGIRKGTLLGLFFLMGTLSLLWWLCFAKRRKIVDYALVWEITTYITDLESIVSNLVILKQLYNQITTCETCSFQNLLLLLISLFLWLVLTVSFDQGIREYVQDVADEAIGDGSEMNTFTGRVKASIRRVSKRRKEKREENRLKHAPKTAKQRKQELEMERPWQTAQNRQQKNRYR